MSHKMQLGKKNSTKNGLHARSANLLPICIDPYSNLFTQWVQILLANIYEKAYCY